MFEFSFTFCLVGIVLFWLGHLCGGWLRSRGFTLTEVCVTACLMVVIIGCVRVWHGPCFWNVDGACEELPIVEAESPEVVFNIIDPLLPHVEAPTGYSRRDFLNALRRAETNAEPNSGIGAVGDGVDSIGPYQIQRAYFTDAKRVDPSLRFYSTCSTSIVYSEQVIDAYLSHYGKDKWTRVLSGEGSLADCKWLARLHNGGPRGNTKSKTLTHWASVQSYLVN